jgi:hypothetical protein
MFSVPSNDVPAIVRAVANFVATVAVSANTAFAGLYTFAFFRKSP